MMEGFSGHSPLSFFQFTDIDKNEVFDEQLTPHHQGAKAISNIFRSVIQLTYIGIDKYEIDHIWTEFRLGSDNYVADIAPIY